jgi:hypothetical protein
MTDEVKSTWDEVLEDFEKVLDGLHIEDESDRSILTMGAFRCFSEGFWRGLERVFDSNGPPIA